MKTKDDKKAKKTANHIIKKVLRNKKKITIISLAGVGIVALLVIFALFWNFSKKEYYASSKEIDDTTFESPEIQDLDLNHIIQENASEPIREQIVTEELDLEYTTIYQNNNKLPKGTIQVLQEGRDGRQQVVNKKTYKGDTLIKEEQSGNMVTKASMSKIVEIGTGSFKESNYRVKKGDILYVTSYTLNMMQQPDKNSEKITTISKDKEVVFQQQKDGWYQVTYLSFTGWVDGQCLSYKNLEQGQTQQVKTAKSKTELISSLSENMNLNKPSGLTIEQFKQIISDCGDDKNKVFEQSAEYFYYIEKQYNINGIFVAAVGIHESSWGTSKIALNKKNLFGYGANDGDAYNSAYQFSNYAEGIDLIARVFVKYYLNPSGTKIYDGEIASGKYYTSPTIASVNKRYASDKNWKTGVYQWMKYLYNRL